MIIYKATNKINGKFYIGKTIKSLQRRKTNHKGNANYLKNHNMKISYFHNAINKYGIENFEWEIIDTATTLQELNEKEIYWILQTSAFINDDIGYNTTSGGDSGPIICGKQHHKWGKKCSEEEIEKFKKWMKKYWNSKTYRKQLSKTMIDYHEKHPELRKEQSKKIKKYYKEHPEALIKNRLQKSCTPIEIDGIQYNSISEASRQLDIHKSTIFIRIKSKNFKTYKYIKRIK